MYTVNVLHSYIVNREYILCKSVLYSYQCIGGTPREEALVDLDVKMQRERELGARREPFGGATSGRVLHVRVVQ